MKVLAVRSRARPASAATLLAFAFAACPGGSAGSRSACTHCAVTAATT